MQISINENILKELQYMVDLHKQYGAANAHESVESLVAYVLAAIADGSRRPGAWERHLLELTGLVADCPEHMQYRSQYGKPDESSL